MSPYSCAQHACFVLRQLTFTISDGVLHANVGLYKDKVLPRLDKIRELAQEIEDAIRKEEEGED